MKINEDLSNIVVKTTQPVNNNKIWLQHSSNMFPANNIAVN